MEKPRHPESLSSCRNSSDVSYYVKNKVELCIQNYMSLERTAKYLEKNHQISKTITHSVWEQLRKENPDFFVHFDLRCQMDLQMKMFNDMLTKQAVKMFENGLLDICDASTSVRSLLRQKHPERVHLLETLASKRKMGSASSAMPYANGISVTHSQNPYDQVLNLASSELPYANGPLVAQSQNPYDQQYQVLNSASFAMPNPNGPSVSQWQMHNEQQLNEHLYTTSLPLGATNVISVTQLPTSYDQQEKHLYTTSLPLPAANGPSMTQMPIPYDQQDQHPYTTSLPFPTANGPSITFSFPVDNSLGAPTFAPVTTDDWLAFADLPTLDPGDNIGHNGPSCQDTLMHYEEEQQQNLIGQWQQQQQNVQVVEGSIDELLSDIVDITYTSVHQQQAGGVERGHHPESEAQQLDEQMQQNVQVVEAQQTMQSKKMCTRVDQHKQAAGGVQRHHPESEALNNPENGYTGHNGPGDSSAAQLVMQPSEQPQHQNGHYQLQQNVPVETLQRGDISNDNELCNNFEQKQSKRMCTSFDQQQAGKVKRHCPESEALNYPNSGNGTAVNQQRSSTARATTRQYESEQ